MAHGYEFDEVRNPVLKKALQDIFDTTSGHDHDGTNSKLVSASAIADDAVTEAKIKDGAVTTNKLGADAVDGTKIADDAIGNEHIADNAVNTAQIADDAIKSAQIADGAVVEAAIGTGAVTEDKIAAGAVTSTKLAAGVLAGYIRKGKIQLNGVNPTRVLFQSDDAATLTGTETATFDMTGVRDGGTFIVNPDGSGEDTATFNFAQATSVSGATPSTDISGGTDKKFMISVDGDAAEEVELTVAGLNSGTAIATAMQNAIQALAGKKTGVTVDYNVTNAGKYTIISPTYGTNSSVVITAPTSYSLLEELKLGADFGVETAGKGDCADASAVTIDEVIAVITSDIAGATATSDSGALKITSGTTGRGSSLVVGNGTLNTVLGFTNTQSHYGAQGLDYTSDMSDANFIVCATIDGTAPASLASLNLSITSKATTGFSVECETTASEAYVDLIIV